ncbi:MAG: phage scaffolding protein [Firmicutes bacterium]|nr:phage scaffolding protein [Bacillota bacterium]
MKNIEQILKDAGIELTDEQKAAINAAVTENYRTKSDYDKQSKKLEAAETDRDTYKGQLDTANETLEKFKDIDPEKQAAEIEKYKTVAKEAQDTAAKQILQRDQRDYLKGEFDKLEIKSERTRNSLMADIMDAENGLKWKDGAFMGLSDYLAKENEKDHFYQTEAEKAEDAAKNAAAGSAPKFTDKSEGNPAGGDDKPTFNFRFTPIRDVKKGD